MKKRCSSIRDVFEFAQKSMKRAERLTGRDKDEKRPKAPLYEFIALHTNVCISCLTDRQTNEWLNLYSRCKDFPGVLPDKGGISDQSAKTMAAFDVIRNTIAEIRKEDREDQERKNDKKNKKGKPKKKEGVI